MRINHKVLSIPPYISTSWKNVSSLQSKKTDNEYFLVIQLKNGSCVLVPDLNEALFEAIFSAHAKHIELENKALSISHKKPKKLDFVQF